MGSRAHKKTRGGGRGGGYILRERIAKMYSFSGKSEQVKKGKKVVEKIKERLAKNATGQESGKILKPPKSMCTGTVEKIFLTKIARACTTPCK